LRANSQKVFFKTQKKMKITLNRLVMIGLLAFATGALPSCSGQTKKETTQSEIVDKEHNSKYICPMYCEGSGSQNPGDCPVCHMHYVENKDYKALK